jgi:hypothetical protein
MTPDGAAMMFNLGMELELIALFFGVTVDEVILALRQHNEEEHHPTEFSISNL